MFVGCTQCRLGSEPVLKLLKGRSYGSCSFFVYIMVMSFMSINEDLVVNFRRLTDSTENNSSDSLSLLHNWVKQFTQTP